MACADKTTAGVAFYCIGSGHVLIVGFSPLKNKRCAESRAPEGHGPLGFCFASGLCLLGSSSLLAGCLRALPLHLIGQPGFFRFSGWLPWRFALTSCWACWVLRLFWLAAFDLCPYILTGLLGVFSLLLRWLCALPLHPVGLVGFFLPSAWWPLRFAPTSGWASWGCSLLAGCPVALNLNLFGPPQSFLSSR